MRAKYRKFTVELAEEALQILEPESSGPLFTHRGPRITDGLDTSLVHNVDLSAFEKRVNKLFDWHKNEEVCNEFLAPYFAIVQASGMGKTKILIEFRRKHRDSPNFMCKTILCIDANLKHDNEQKYFDSRFDVDTEDENLVTENVSEYLDNLLLQMPRALQT